MADLPIMDNPTIKGMKRRAKKLKKETEGLTHTKALERVAMQHGFTCWKNALNELPPEESDHGTQHHQVFQRG